ncbi:MAG: glycine cleavage T C-terminal barrel domain-containing protein [Myxococcota bacterium]
MPRDPAERVRAAIGLFAMDDRGLIEVRGSDRIRWLDGMITADVKALEKRGEGAGALALLLTHRGAIVADLRVGRLGETLLLECAKSDQERIRAALEKRIIADDVVLADRGEAFAVLGVEGARSGDVVARALAAASLPAAFDWAELSFEGGSLLAAGFGWSGEEAYQLRVAPSGLAGLRAAIERAAEVLGVDCVAGDPALLELLRIEAGIPALGAELGEDVLPPEARLERAVAINKGCYVGQEIVARLRSRGQVNHLLVGLRLEGAAPSAIGTPLEGDALPAIGTPLVVAGRATGEITSVVHSPSQGAIALGYVRREHAGVGTRLELAGGSATATVAELPFVRLRASPPAPPSPGGA